ncbi:hypothetical protein HID58_089627 [Brassica napus]|uniref:RHOMBOID-like protein n=1 Tax=Brassica napus TaxID=3708 RepID=A0ABQ7XZQ5_BRANA|nr:hypothetical protein HID58_089627 [Brassica napus]
MFRIAKEKEKGDLVVAFSGGEMQRRIETAEGRVLGEARIAIEQHLRFHTKERKTKEDETETQPDFPILPLSLAPLAPQRERVMAIGDDDLENRMSAKPHHRGIGSKGGDRTGFGPPPLVYSDLGGDASPQWTSWLVPMFVVANVAVFVVTMFVNNCPAHSHGPNRRCVAEFLGRLSFEPLRGNPLFGPSSRTLEKLGSLEWDRVVEKHQGWRLLTCIWLHAGVIHLAANMLSLVFIGIRLEQQFGFVRIGVIYLLSGIGGSILSSLFVRNSISVGASGALFGLLGSMLSELLTNWTIYSNKIAALLTLLFVIAINLAIGILPHVDNFAHVGGFLTGFLLGFVLLARPQFKWLARENMPQGRRLTSKYKPYQYLLWLLSLALLVLGFVMALVLLFKGEDGNDHCRWCRYLRCIPTSRWSCDDRSVMSVVDDMENQMPAKHHQGIGSRGGEQDGLGPSPRPVVPPLVYAEFGDDDELSPQWTSWLIPMFVVANVIVFFATMSVNNCPQHSKHCVARFLGRFSFEHLRDNPLFGPSSLTLEKLGSLDWYRVVEKHQAWRLLTCIWLHAGMGGSILSSLFIRNDISVGASGALFGLLGSMLSELLTNWTIYSNKIAAFLTLLCCHCDKPGHWESTLHQVVRKTAHMPQGRRLTSKYKPYQYILWLLSLALLIAGFVVALVLLFKGEDGNDHCHWCRYLSCIPTSRWSCDSTNVDPCWYEICTVASSQKKIHNSD